MLKETQANVLLDILNVLSDSTDRFFSSPKPSLVLSHILLSRLHRLLRASHASDLVLARLLLCIDALDRKILQGGRYEYLFDLAMRESIDAFEQYAFACQLNHQYAEQTSNLFRDGRACWQRMEEVARNIAEIRPIRYRAVMKKTVDELLVERLLELSMVGEVHFCPQPMSETLNDAVYQVVSIHSDDWLKARFPYLSWQREGDLPSTGAQLKDGYIAIFFSDFLPKFERYRQLDGMAEAIRALEYVCFQDALLPWSENHIEQGERMVPRSGIENLNAFLDNESYLAPVRIAGSFYAFQIGKNDSIPSLLWLGRDSLSSWLYIIKCCGQSFAFEQSECLACLSIASVEFSFSETLNCWLGEYEKGECVPVCMLEGVDFPLDPKHYSVEKAKFIVVRQGSRLIGVLAQEILQEEGLCATAYYKGAVVKNVWLTNKALPFIEPWLYPFKYDSNPVVKVSYQETGDKIVKSRREGYYRITFDACYLWIDAGLVLDVVSRQMLKSVFSSIENNVEHVLVYGAQYFNCLVSKRGGEQGTVVLLDPHVSLACISDECKWYQTLPECMTDITCLSGQLSDGIVYLEPAAHSKEKHFLINQDNIEAFISRLWSLPS